MSLRYNLDFALLLGSLAGIASLPSALGVYGVILIGVLFLEAAFSLGGAYIFCGKQVA